MGYKLKTHSGAAKRFKKTGSSVKSKSANRNHILTKQSTKRKRHNRGLNKLTGTVTDFVTLGMIYYLLINAEAIFRTVPVNLLRPLLCLFLLVDCFVRI